MFKVSKEDQLKYFKKANISSIKEAFPNQHSSLCYIAKSCPADERGVVISCPLCIGTVKFEEMHKITKHLDWDNYIQAHDIWEVLIK